MRIWLAKIGEPIAALDPSQRPMRMSLLAQAFLDRGHEVTWWASTFMHSTKKYIATCGGRNRVRPGFEVELLHEKGYARHLSLARVQHHSRTAAAFSRLAPLRPPPDLIVSALPTPELCMAVARFSERANVPFVVDVRDWWPDAFSLSYPRPIRPLIRLLLTPLDYRVRTALRAASAITGITEAFVDWGVSKARRARRPDDRAFPHGYLERAASEDERRKARAAWARHGIDLDAQEGTPPIIAFAGTFGHSHDVDTILDAARIISVNGTQAKFVLCGDGERFREYQERARKIPGVVLPGWVGWVELEVLLEAAVLGVNLVPRRADFLASINNKVIEYLRFGLPLIVSPAQSEVGRLVVKAGCGAVVEGHSPRELALVIGALLSDVERQKEMARASRRLFEATFRATDVYGAMAAHLETIARPK